MRLNQFEINHFQGLHHAALVVSAPLLLVSGGNGAGKSSFLDAISMALTGQPRRVSLKKDIAQLITEGHKKGDVTLGTENGVFSVTLPNGKGVHLVDEPFLPFVLDASRFAAIDGKERRKLLFELTGASANPKEVAKLLAKRGAPQAMIERVKPMLMSGFPAAADQAKEQASQARGAWKQLTGENYGSEKAEGWQPERPDVTVTDEDIAAAKSALDAIEQDLVDATETLGASKAAAAQAEQQQARIAALRELVDLTQRRQQKLDRDTADLAHWQSQLDSAIAAAAGAKAGLIHDMGRTLAEFESIVTGSDGYVIDTNLARWPITKAAEMVVEVMERYRAEHGDPNAEGDAELAKRKPEFQTYVDNLTRTVANSQRDLNESVTAAATLAELQTAAQPISPEAIENAEKLIGQLRQQRDAARAKFDSLVEAQNAASQHEATVADAAKHHAAVKAWSNIAEALAPTGIPAEILATALTPVNDLLRDLAAVAGWKEARINGDIEITYGERLYGLLSESEKWRVDTLLAVTIARLSGLAFVAIDRFDVLEPKARPQALKLLLNATQNGTLDQAIMAGTMKEPMAKVPNGIQQVWIESGVLADEAPLKVVGG